jgi:DNA-binding NarL/FixJ family response regulator
MFHVTNATIVAMEDMKIRILIVDDHQSFREVLKELFALQADIEVVGEAQNGQEAIELSRKLRPDVILMDVKMPVMDGVEATHRILAETPDRKILALSFYPDDGFVKDIMRAGALRYILKGSDFEELIAAIRKETAPGNARLLQ